MSSSLPPTSRVYKPSPTYTAEDADLYRPGGLHPVHLGDSLKSGRYKILHKLGFGSWSTVWLARDQLKSSYMAIKIIEGAGYDPHAIELEVSHRLQQGDQNHPGRQFVTILSDEFVITGPNGTHQCYVTEVAGPRLTRPKDLKYDDLRDARWLVSQVFRAIQYLHSCGIVHADLHPDNVLLQLENFDYWSEEELYSILGTPIREKVELLDPSAPVAGSAPTYLVHPCNVSALTEPLLLNRILLIDFGASFFFEAAPTDIRAPAQYTPPEVLYGTGIITPAIDQWTLGCLLFEICAGYTLFKMLFNPQTDVLKDLVSMMGKPPEWMWKLWEERRRYFHSDGSPITGTKGIEVMPHSLYSRIEDMARLYINGDYASKVQGRGPENLLTQELEDMYDLLRQLLVYEPELRLSIEKCLEHPFLAGSERV